MQQQPKLEPVRETVRTALVVEPAPAMARLLTRMIRDLGFAVIEASGPDEALAEIECRAAEIDLVVSELSLTEVSGPKLASFIAQRRPDIPIVLLCDQAIPTSAAIAARAAFLPKPFSRDQLAGAIQTFAARNS
jgi:CheY-like chemotaxis protein